MSPTPAPTATPTVSTQSTQSTQSTESTESTQSTSPTSTNPAARPNPTPRANLAARSIPAAGSSATVVGAARRSGGSPALRLVFDPQGLLRERSRQCEAEAFLRRYGNTAEQLALQYGPYEAQCVFISLIDKQDEVIATTRVTAPGPLGNKTLDDCSLPVWGVDGDRALRSCGVDPAATWDVTTISVRSGTQRATFASAALYHGLIQTMRANGAEATVAILDARVRLLLGTLGLRYRAIPGTFEANYLGSPASVPVFAPFAAMMDEQRRRMPDSYRLLALGVGLDDIALPPMQAFRFRARPQSLDLRETPAGSAAGHAPDLLSGH